MTIYIDFIEDNDGDLVDIEYFCSANCYSASTGNPAFGHSYPCGDETDYPVYCTHCGDLLWEGLENGL